MPLASAGPGTNIIEGFKKRIEKLTKITPLLISVPCSYRYHLSLHASEVWQFRPIPVCVVRVSFGISIVSNLISISVSGNDYDWNRSFWPIRCMLCELCFDVPSAVCGGIFNTKQIGAKFFISWLWGKRLVVCTKAAFSSSERNAHWPTNISVLILGE